MGLNNKDISVYIFLFVKKWIEKQAPLSSSKIYKDLVSITNFFPPKLGITYSEKSVSVSLKKLVTMGFVSRCINDQKIKSEGRPATALYESDTIATVKKNIDNILDEYRKNILHIMSPLEAIEETITLRDSGEEK